MADEELTWNGGKYIPHPGSQDDFLGQHLVPLRILRLKPLVRLDKLGDLPINELGPLISLLDLRAGFAPVCFGGDGLMTEDGVSGRGLDVAVKTRVIDNSGSAESGEHKSG